MSGDSIDWAAVESPSGVKACVHLNWGIPLRITLEDSYVLDECVLIGVV